MNLIILCYCIIFTQYLSIRTWLSKELLDMVIINDYATPYTVYCFWKQFSRDETSSIDLLRKYSNWGGRK